MQIAHAHIALACVLISLAGIAFLFLLSEAPAKISVAEAKLSNPNTLVEISGAAANITADKFLLCQGICITVRKNNLVPAMLIQEGDYVRLMGRVKEYRGSVYLVAEEIKK